MGGSKIGAARVGDGRNADLSVLGREAGQTFEPFDTCSAERLGVGHHVGLAHRHKVAGAEITSDPDLVFDRQLQSRAEIAGPPRLFLRGQPHLARPPARVALSGVMAGLVPAIRVFLVEGAPRKSGCPTSAGMTAERQSKRAPATGSSTVARTDAHTDEDCGGD